jgi:ATP-dependent phosphofructokinase / diphosphate-dependent phosphofructokinase
MLNITLEKTDMMGRYDHRKRGMKKIAVMTGGGDCPGLNAAIRAVVITGLQYHRETLGIRNGWKGLIDGDLLPLNDSSVSGIISWGGTILGTSRTDPMKDSADLKKIKKNIRLNDIGALVVIGGNGTLSAAHEVSEKGVPVVGIPKTIDNDIFGTDSAVGFDTAISVVMEAIDRLHTTAESHHRIMVVEVMGRNAGWIALISGIAGGGDMILIPEIRFTIDQICRDLDARYKAGKKFSIVVIAEGTHHEDIAEMDVPECIRDECGHEKFVGVGNLLGKELEHRLGIEARVTVLGHVQRGGTPTASDRVLATRFGISAVEQILAGNVGCMVTLQGSQIGTVPLKDVASRIKPVDPDLYHHLSMIQHKIQ